MKKVLMILAEENFRDIEYLVPKAFFEREGFKVDTTSSKLTSVGKFGYEVNHDFLLNNVNVSSYNAVCFVGGGGSLQYIENDVAKNIAVECLKQSKPLGAICAAPRNFLAWGLLNGKKLTGHNWDGQLESLSEKSGAKAFPALVTVQDDLILTGNGAEASEEFALLFIEMINKN